MSSARSDEREVRRAQLLELWEAACRADRRPTLDEFLEEHCPDDPELRAELRAQLPELAADRAWFRPFSAPGAGRLSPGDEVAGYRILEVLGEGGMGVVYRAHHGELDRDDALKMILREDVSEVDLDRFRREAQLLASLEHPHIVHVHAWGEHAGRPYFVMECVRGGNLAEKLAGQPQDPRESARLVMLLARAVQAAHERKILHRDLKPKNILLAPGGDVAELNTAWGWPKVADFGLAKRFDQPPGNTVAGTPLGTPAYGAPEQLEGRLDEIGPATDVYGLGAILYEMLAGHHHRQRAGGLFREAPPLRPERPVVPACLEAICLKSLAVRPGDRYPTAAAVAEALRAFLEEGLDTTRSAPPAPPLPPPRRRITRTLLGIGLVGLTLLVILAVSSWYHQPTRTPGKAPDVVGEEQAAKTPPNPQPPTLESVLVEGKPPLAPGSPPRLALDVLKWDPARQSFSVLQDGDVLRSRVDQYAIVARPGTAGCLYLFQIDSHGYVNWYFPKNADADSCGANPVPGGLPVNVPPVESKRGLTLDDRVGEESVVAVLSTAPWPDLEAGLAKAVERQARLQVVVRDRGGAGSRPLAPATEIQVFNDMTVRLDGVEFEASDRFIQVVRRFKHE